MAELTLNKVTAIDPIQEFNSLLNDLIHINYERTKTLKKAIALLKDEDGDLIPILDQMIMDCRDNIRNLKCLDFSKGKFSVEMPEKLLINYEDEDAILKTGPLFANWLKECPAFQGNERHAILEVCEIRENASIRAYEDAQSHSSLQNSNPVIQRDLDIQLTFIKNALKRLHNLNKIWH